LQLQSVLSKTWALETSAGITKYGGALMFPMTRMTNSFVWQNVEPSEANILWFASLGTGNFFNGKYVEL